MYAPHSGYEKHLPIRTTAEKLGRSRPETERVLRYLDSIIKNLPPLDGGIKHIAIGVRRGRAIMLSPAVVSLIHKEFRELENFHRKKSLLPVSQISSEYKIRAPFIRQVFREGHARGIQHKSGKGSVFIHPGEIQKILELAKKTGNIGRKGDSLSLTGLKKLVPEGSTAGKKLACLLGNFSGREPSSVGDIFIEKINEHGITEKDLLNHMAHLSNEVESKRLEIRAIRQQSGNKGATEKEMELISELNPMVMNRNFLEDILSIMKNRK